MKLVLLLLCLTTLTYGQSVKITVNGVSPDSVIVNIIPPKPVEKKYLPYPAEPVFTSPNTIALSGNQSVFGSTLAGKTEQVLSGKATNLTLNGIGGTLDKPIRFKGGTIEGTSTTQRSVRTLNNTKHFQLHNMKLSGNDGGVMLSSTDGGSVLLSDVEIINPLFAGFWCNTGKGRYDKLNSSFLRVINSGGEGIYIGNTSSANRSLIQQSHHENLFIQNAGWDGIQLTSVNDLYINKFTIIGAGTKKVAGQNTLMQLQMCNGLVENGIAIGGTSSLSIFSHGLTIRNSYFQWTSEDAIYIGEATGEPQLNGQPLVFDGSIFNVPGSKPLFTVAMKGADVIVKNCTISDNRKGLFTDSRGTASNKLIDGGGNKFIPASQIPVPKFNADGTVADDFYYSKGFGFRTP